MKTSIVHDWLVAKGGAEKVLEAIHSLFPAKVYTLVKAGSWPYEVETSFLQRVPFSTKYYRYLLPFFSRAIESFDLSEYDLILSSSHAVAKGVRKREGQLHICYCHTPVRYAWDLQEQYLSTLKGLKKTLAKRTLAKLREWDLRTAAGVDHFIANSKFVAKRIKTTYGRESTVIYPPVDVESFQLQKGKEPFYLAASRLVPYKRIDLIVEAFANMPQKRLVVIGDGPEMAKVRAKASSNVEILGYQTGEVLCDYMQRAKAFVFAAEEDFGIVPVEAQACGTPVLAFGKGGARETVVEGVTGHFFEEQVVESLIQGVQAFERMDFDPLAIRRHAQQFSTERFKKEYAAFVERALLERGGS